MKNRRLKGFTLVEILIVIVIIGILIGALVPRMSVAQGRARDVARKNDLAQLQSAIVTSQQDKGKWPGMDTPSSGVAINGMAISGIQDLLTTAGMNSVPSDPLQSNKVTGLGSGTDNIGAGQYGYMVSKRNGTANAGFVLMAKTEVEGGSNRVVCSGADALASGYIGVGADLGKISLCTSLNKVSSGCGINSGACTYNLDGELRYVLLY